jgi:hypothetical protein
LETDSTDWITHLLRLPFVKGLWTRFPIGSLALRVQYGIFREYPQYGYGVYQAALLASQLKIPRITAIEFGVAGGRGLVALEKISSEVEKALGVGIDVIGFDTGESMPEAADYRDLPHVWGRGFYKMDVCARRMIGLAAQSKRVRPAERSAQQACRFAPGCRLLHPADDVFVPPARCRFSNHRSGSQFSNCSAAGFSPNANRPGNASRKYACASMPRCLSVPITL